MPEAITDEMLANDPVLAQARADAISRVGPNSRTLDQYTWSLYDTLINGPLVPLKAKPVQPTMSKHDIAAVLWVTNKDAYYNFMYYIDEADRISDALRDALLRSTQRG